MTAASHQVHTGPKGLFARFFHSEASGSVNLLLATAAALAWANSPWARHYESMLHAPIGVAVGSWSFAMPAQHWVNDALMTLFFFVVGLEIKRELVVGQLSSVRSALLPVLAAAGGIVVPAAIYASINAGGAGAPGWGIPMATDIAFALGVLALLGPRVPVGLKVFLAALAIADDLGAVLVIALFYTSSVSAPALALAAALLALLWAMPRLGVRRFEAYLLVAAGIWAATLASGVHATVAGVLVAMVTPVKGAIEPGVFLGLVRGRLDALERRPLTRASPATDRAQMEALEEVGQATLDFLPAGHAMERYLHPVTAHAVLPLFALFNAGVRLDVDPGAALSHPVGLGVILGLVLGKQAGITLASWVAVRSGWAALPDGVTMRHVHGASILGGIGFTMSIFVAGLAFPGNEALLASAKIGILAASLVAGLAGYCVLRLILRRGVGT